MKSKIPVKLLMSVLTKTPELIRFFGKSLYRKHIGVERDLLAGDGIARKPPYMMSLRITNACNHRCAVCGQYGDKGYMHGSDRKHLLKTLPVERYMQVVDELAKDKPLYYVTGGEPFLYKDLVPFVNYAKKKGSAVSVVTNGIKLKENAREIVENGWDMILVSFDGPEHIHYKCRSLKGAYKTTIEGLSELTRIKKEMKKKKPYILTSTTLSQTNIDYLAETFEIGKTIMPDLMVVYLSWFTSNAIGHRQAKILKDEFGVDAFTWKSYATKFSEADGKQIQEGLKKVRGMKWPFEYFVIPDLNDKDLPSYYTCPEKMFGYNNCVAPYLMFDIMPNGDVTTCRDYIDIKVGNIMDNSVLEIWNNDKFKHFRKVLHKHNGLLPQCSRCCGLMGF